MKKVITVFDGENFPETGINFVKEYPSDKKPLLVGVFLSAVDYSNEFSSISMGGNIVPVIEDVEKVSANIKKFKSLCEQAHIEYKVHNDSGEEALEQLREETIFADLLILSSEHFYNSMNLEQPGANMKNILERTECPVLLLPDNFTYPKKNILAYDGSETSVYAIKQFSYVFPEFRVNSTTLVFASEQEENIPQEQLVEELGSRHFNELKLQKLDFSPRKYFSTWLTGLNDAILVTGGYSRKGLRSIFHKNFMSEVIADHRLPVFIAHK